MLLLWLVSYVSYHIIILPDTMTGDGQHDSYW